MVDLVSPFVLRVIPKEPSGPGIPVFSTSSPFVAAIMHQQGCTLQVLGLDVVGVGVLDFEVEDGDAFGAGFQAGGYQRLDLALGAGALVADLEFGGGEEVTFGQYEEGVLVGRLDPVTLGVRADELQDPQFVGRALEMVHHPVVADFTGSGVHRQHHVPDPQPLDALGHVTGLGLCRCEHRGYGVSGRLRGRAIDILRQTLPEEQSAQQQAGSHPELPLAMRMPRIG